MSITKNCYGIFLFLKTFIYFLNITLIIFLLHTHIVALFLVDLVCHLSRIKGYIGVDNKYVIRIIFFILIFIKLFHMILLFITYSFCSLFLDDLIYQLLYNLRTSWS
jgi:hypothetical protein